MIILILFDVIIFIVLFFLTKKIFPIYYMNPQKFKDCLQLYFNKEYYTNNINLSINNLDNTSAFLGDYANRCYDNLDINLNYSHFTNLLDSLVLKYTDFYDSEKKNFIYTSRFSKVYFLINICVSLYFLKLGNYLFSSAFFGFSFLCALVLFFYLKRILIAKVDRLISDDLDYKGILEYLYIADDYDRVKRIKDDYKNNRPKYIVHGRIINNIGLINSINSNYFKSKKNFRTAIWILIYISYWILLMASFSIPMLLHGFSLKTFLPETLFHICSFDMLKMILLCYIPTAVFVVSLVVIIIYRLKCIYNNLNAKNKPWTSTDSVISELIILVSLIFLRLIFKYYFTYFSMLLINVYLLTILLLKKKEKKLI